MKEYTGTKTLKAKPLALGEYNALRGWTTPEDEDPLREGYLLEYPLVGDSDRPNHPDFEGYVSWTPKETFEQSYRENGSLTFGDAIKALKEGKRVCRYGWNGKDMFLELIPAGNAMFREWPMQDCIGMKTAQEKMQPGWLASQSDIFSEDWIIL